jgi:hypothetical protein
VDVPGEAQLGDDERRLAGDDLQVAQVGPEPGRVLEEDVEAGQVEPVDVEVLGRREVAVGHEHGRVGGVDVGGQLREHPLHGPDPVQSHQVAGHLVADRDREDGGLAVEPLHRLVEGPPPASSTCRCAPRPVPTCRQSS